MAAERTRVVCDELRAGLAAYGAPGWIDVHPVAGNRWLPYGAGNYNDMGVLTALVFVVLGCALAAVGPRRNRALGSVLVAVLAAIAPVWYGNEVWLAAAADCEIGATGPVVSIGATSALPRSRGNCSPGNTSAVGASPVMP